MGSIIKEVIIMLLVCLVGILLFAVIFYEFIPNRKVVAETVKYQATSEVRQLLSDNVDNRENQVLKTYTVTSSDLNNYEQTNDYVPGKADPFAEVSESIKGKGSTKSSSKSGSSSGNSSSSGNTSESGGYISDNGTK